MTMELCQLSYFRRTLSKLHSRKFDQHLKRGNLFGLYSTLNVSASALVEEFNIRTNLVKSVLLYKIQMLEILKSFINFQK
jgi:hypothetical protein